MPTIRSNRQSASCRRKNALRAAARRARETPEQTAARRAANAARAAARRAQETPEEKALRRASNAARATARRARETAEQTAARRAADAARDAARRAQEAPEQRAARRAASAARYAARRAMIPPDGVSEGDGVVDAFRDDACAQGAADAIRAVGAETRARHPTAKPATSQEILERSSTQSTSGTYSAHENEHDLAAWLASNVARIVQAGVKSE